MRFDIHQLDDMDRESEEFESALSTYLDALQMQFVRSPEAEAHTQTGRKLGFYADTLITFAYQYLGETLTELTASDVAYIVSDLFPEKLSVLSTEQAEDIVPELIAFWQFLKREYGLPEADDILAMLREIEPDFPELMSDVGNFGMAKTLFTTGQAMGFDMTNEEDALRFMQTFNETVAGDIAGLDLLDEGPSGRRPRKAPRDKKKRRKQAQASRRKNRRR